RLPFLHVGSAREGAPIAAQDRDFGRGVLIEMTQGGGELIRELVGEGVELLWPVQRDGADAVPAPIFDKPCRIPQVTVPADPHPPSSRRPFRQWHRQRRSSAHWGFRA